MRGRYDVVHTHLLRADMYGALAARAARVPGLVATKHNLEARLETPGLALAPSADGAECRTSPSASRTPCASWAVTTGGAPAAKTRVVLYGIDPAPFEHLDRCDGPGAELGIEPDARVVLCPARLDPQKNHGMLLRAFEHVHRELPNAVLLLAGGRQLGSDDLRARPPHACRFRRRRRRGALAGSPERHVRACWRRATSWRWRRNGKGFGLALLEAMAAGATQWWPPPSEAFPKWCSDGENGFLVSSGDTVRESPTALTRVLLGDDATRRRLGAAAAQRARKTASP